MDATAKSDSSFPALEVALAALVCFLPAVAVGYSYDDLTLVRDNAHAHALGELPHAFTTRFWPGGAAARGALPYYRPLVTASYIVNWVIAGGKPWVFHFTNAALHAVATYLVVRIVQRWTGRTAVAVAVATIFALHPSRTENVEWIAGRTDVLMTVFLLLAVEASHAFAVESDGRRRAFLQAGSTAAFIAALLSKEAALVLPLLLMVDVLSTIERTTRPALVKGVVWHSAIAAAYLVIRPLFLPLGGGSHALTPRYGLYTVFAYAERVVFPWPQTFFHRPVIVEGGKFVLAPPLVACGALILVLYAAQVVEAWRRDRAAAVLLVAAIASLGPLLNFTHTGVFVTTSDHFLYLPLLLFLAGLGRRHGDRVSGWATARGARLAFGGVLVLYLAIDWLRVVDYRNQETLFEHELAVNPQNPQALRALSEVRAREGNVEEAFELLRRASLPAAARYEMLLPDYRLYENYLRMLGFMAAMTADGNVHDLTLLYRELDALLAGRTDTVRGRVGDLVLGRPVSPGLHAYALSYGTRDTLAVEAGFLAVRLGDDAHGRKLLGTIDDRHIDDLPNVQNIALAYARLHDFPAALRWLDAPARRFPDRFSKDSLVPVKGSFALAESDFRRADAASSVERASARAQAYLDLGAYLRALRVLRPAYDAEPTNTRVGSMYLHLLIGAGLEQEALVVAVRALGWGPGAALVAQIHAGMSERLKSLRKPVEPSDWYVAESAP